MWSPKDNYVISLGIATGVRWDTYVHAHVAMTNIHSHAAGKPTTTIFSDEVPSFLSLFEDASKMWTCKVWVWVQDVTLLYRTLQFYKR